MNGLLPQLLAAMAETQPQLPALRYRRQMVNYGDLWDRVRIAAGSFVGLGLGRGERIAVWLDKSVETVVAMMAASAAGCVFVPVNPVFKAAQVLHILRDCNVRVLLTSNGRFQLLAPDLASCHDLRAVALIDAAAGEKPAPGVALLPWSQLSAAGDGRAGHRVIDIDMTAILYTSGSTGMPKGVVLSHRNMVAGAKSVSQYLGNTAEDRILSVLPLSFDAGLSQLTTAFNVGACVVLMNYLLPNDVVKVCAEERITGLTCVPPLWIRLAQLDWPPEAAQSMRYFANTGGHMPGPVLQRLRAAMPKAKPYLMYGLTEAFRSTYLDPAEVDRRPDSIGKAIPNAEILVVRENGERCAPHEHGELVHRGALVAQGYWNDPERTAQRFRPAPGQPPGLPLPELAVWSGDTVYADAEGFLYFVGRRDEMIKTSGYRVSPTEVEEAVYASGLVAEAAALGVPHQVLGQGIVLVVVPVDPQAFDVASLMAHCRKDLPPYMVPGKIIAQAALPRNPNGKIDRKSLAAEFGDAFKEQMP